MWLWSKHHFNIYQNLQITWIIAGKYSSGLKKCSFDNKIIIQSALKKEEKSNVAWIWKFEASYLYGIFFKKL
jgi:hypothetical protein